MPTTPSVRSWRGVWRLSPRNHAPDHLPTEIRDHPEVITACQQHDIGKLFRLVNNLSDGPAQFSPSHLARRCSMTPSRVSEYMAGKHRATTVGVIVRIADALRIPGPRFGLEPRPWELTGDPASMTGSVSAAGTALPDPLSLAPGVSAGAYPTDAEPGASSANRRQPLTDADTTVIRGMLTALTASDHQFGGGYARRAAVSFLADAIEPRLHTPGPETVRQDLLRVASEFGVRVAWMHLDVADDTTARRTINQAFRWAQDSGDLACAAWVMAMCALQETWIGVPGRALAYAQAAVGLAHGAAPLIRAFAYGKLARARALTGDRAGMLSALGAARDLFDAAPLDGGPALETVKDSYNLAYLLDEEAHCYRDVGDGRLALERSAESLQRRGHDRFARNRAFATSTQALAYIQLGEVEQASNTAASLLALSVSLSSRRVEARTGAVLTALAPYRATPEVDRVREQAVQRGRRRPWPDEGGGIGH